MSENRPDGEYTQLDLIHQEEKAFQKFAAICSANDDEISIPKIYYDITGDHAAAAVLDEILFWTLPNKKRTTTALRVRKDGILWLAVSRTEWWERKRLTERQADRGIEKLIELGLVEKSVHRFNGHGQMHLRVKGKEFFSLYGKALQEQYLKDVDVPESSVQEINDLYEMMGISNSPNRELRNGDSNSPNRDTNNSLQPASIQAIYSKDKILVPSSEEIETKSKRITPEAVAQSILNGAKTPAITWPADLETWGAMWVRLFERAPTKSEKGFIIKELRECIERGYTLEQFETGYHAAVWFDGMTVTHPLACAFAIDEIIRGIRLPTGERKNNKKIKAPPSKRVASAEA